MAQSARSTAAGVAPGPVQGRVLASVLRTLLSPLLAPLLAPVLAPLLALALAGLLIACSDPAPRSRSFITSAEGLRTPADRPVGLNPLGSLDTCQLGAPPLTPGRSPARVLVSRPEAFTREASEMIQALREAMAESAEQLPPVRFLLAPVPVVDAAQARDLGRACEALIVLWEPRLTKSLALTLPDPARVPLRDLVQERLCEFGNHQEQLRILHLTIAGLLSLRENEYERAALYMGAARAIDNRCFRLPGVGTPAAEPPAGGKP